MIVINKEMMRKTIPITQNIVHKTNVSDTVAEFATFKLYSN